jgi:hypothetical protein
VPPLLPLELDRRALSIWPQSFISQEKALLVLLGSQVFLVMSAAGVGAGPGWVEMERHKLCSPQCFGPQLCLPP